MTLGAHKVVQCVAKGKDERQEDEQHHQHLDRHQHATAGLALSCIALGSAKVISAARRLRWCRWCILSRWYGRWVRDATREATRRNQRVVQHCEEQNEDRDDDQRSLERLLDHEAVGLPAAEKQKE